jgi:hypothetical protein
MQALGDAVQKAWRELDAPRSSAPGERGGHGGGRASGHAGGISRIGVGDCNGGGYRGGSPHLQLLTIKERMPGDQLAGPTGWPHHPGTGGLCDYSRSRGFHYDHNERGPTTTATTGGSDWHVYRDRPMDLDPHSTTGVAA